MKEFSTEQLILILQSFQKCEKLLTDKEDIENVRVMIDFITGIIKDRQG